MQKKTGCANARRFDEANQKNRNRPSKKSYYQKKKLQIKKKLAHRKKAYLKKRNRPIIFSPNQKINHGLTRYIEKFKKNKASLHFPSKNKLTSHTKKAVLQLV
jgi:hypothetical protein